VKKETLRGRELADLIAQLADSKKAERISLINLTGTAGIADWFVICQGDNTAHNRAIADAIAEGLKEKNVSAWHIEGREESRWVLLDYSDVVAHVMLPDVRHYYGLEDLWPGATMAAVSGENDDER
jgi:ribosome-associated protein